MWNKSHCRVFFRSVGELKGEIAAAWVTGGSEMSEANHDFLNNDLAQNMEPGESGIPGGWNARQAPLPQDRIQCRTETRSLSGGQFP